MTAFQTLVSSESNEWYTPPWVFDLVRQIGEIGLDPASNEMAQKWIKADCWYGLPTDSMQQPWNTDKGFWMNPPYGSRSKEKGIYGANAWIQRAIAEYQAGSFPWAVLLVRGDCEGIKWLEKNAISCEPNDRISFISPINPNAKNPVPGCRFWYLGENPQKFAEVFEAVGAIRVPYLFWRGAA